MNLDSSSPLTGAWFLGYMQKTHDALHLIPLEQFRIFLDVIYDVRTQFHPWVLLFRLENIWHHLGTHLSHGEMFMKYLSNWFIFCTVTKTAILMDEIMYFLDFYQPFSKLKDVLDMDHLQYLLVFLWRVYTTQKPEYMTYIHSHTLVLRENRSLLQINQVLLKISH